MTEQAVSSYIKAHYEELLPLVDTSDGLSAMMSKHIATKAKGKIDNIAIWPLSSARLRPSVPLDGPFKRSLLCLKYFER